MKGSGGRKSYQKYTKPITENGPLFGNTGGGKDECDINFIAQLQKPQPGLSAVTAGDNLIIELDGNIINVISDTGDLCGNIVSTFNDALIDCMKKGNEYKAIVVSVSGKICKVQIRK